MQLTGFLQIRLHPYTYAEHKSLIQYARLNDIVIEAYSSLSYVHPPFRVPAVDAEFSPLTKYRGGPVDAPVKAAAKKRGVEPSQILFAWVKAKGAVIVT